MKRIKKTLLAGSLACLFAFQAQAQAETPFSGGVKAGFLASYTRMADSEVVRLQGNKAKASTSFWGDGGAYGEYHFCDYAGLQLEALFARQAVALEAENTPGVGVSMKTYQVSFPCSLYLRPFGSEEEVGAFTFHLGGGVSLPLARTLEQDGRAISSQNLTDEQKAELPNWDGGPHVGAGWEFPFGLIVEARGTFPLRSRFLTAAPDVSQTIFPGLSRADQLGAYDVTVNLGWNLASLWTE